MHIHQLDFIIPAFRDTEEMMEYHQALDENDSGDDLGDGHEDDFEETDDTDQFVIEDENIIDSDEETDDVIDPQDLLFLSTSMVAKDETIWNRDNCISQGRRPAYNIFTSRSGPTQFSKQFISQNVSKAFNLNFDYKIVEVIK